MSLGVLNLEGLVDGGAYFLNFTVKSEAVSRSPHPTMPGYLTYVKCASFLCSIMLYAYLLEQ